jgi:hypothetical protein
MLMSQLKIFDVSIEIMRVQKMFAVDRPVREWRGKNNSRRRVLTFTNVIARLDRATQYSLASVMNREAAAYWMPRWSLSSGSPKVRPGGGA